MAEWSNALVLKTSDQKWSVGSNPTASALNKWLLFNIFYNINNSHFYIDDKYNMKKYIILLDDTIKILDITLYRIQAVKDFADVKTGELGGYIASENNLSQDGNCWVYNYAKVYDNALVTGNAKIFDRANIFGFATISESAMIYDLAMIYGHAKICGEAKIGSSCIINDHAQVYGKTVLCNNEVICENKLICRYED